MMDRDARHMMGYRHGVKDAVQFMYARAASMNDPSARATLYCAADNMGAYFARATKPKHEESRKRFPPKPIDEAGKW